MTARMDSDEVRSFATHLGGVAAATRKQQSAVVHRGANNIKRQLREEMGRSRHFRQIVPKIGYDVREVGAFGGGFIEAEIGPAAEGAGYLDNIAYFGTSRGGGTVPDPLGALLDEMPRFESAVADLAADAF